MKQSELAKVLGISPPYLSLIYHGHRRPSWRTAQRIKPVCRRTYEWWRNAKQSEIQKLLNQIAIRKAA